MRTSDEDPDVTQQARKQGDGQGPDNQRRHTLKSSVSTWGSHTKQQRSPQLKLEETHALLPSSKPEGSHVPLSPTAAALSSSLWYALAETHLPITCVAHFPRAPHLLLCPLFQPHPPQTKPANPRTSQVTITQPFSSVPCSLE